MINPYFIFEITPKCNLDCIYCYNIWKQNTDYQQKELSLDKIIFLFEKLSKETQIEGITISGGEPLLFKNLFEVLMFLKQKNIKLGITTNGILLDNLLINKLIDSGISYFEISLDSLNIDNYNYLTNDNQLNKVKQSILNIKQHNVSLTVSTIITAINLQDISNIIDLCFGFSVDFLSLNCFMPSGKGIINKEKLVPTNQQIKEILEIANCKAQKYKQRINISVPIKDCIILHNIYPNLNFGTCACGTKKWLIDSQGNLRICELNPKILGNLFEQNFQELKNSIEVKKFREQTFKKDCKQCNKFLECGGGCRFNLHIL